MFEKYGFIDYLNDHLQCGSGSSTDYSFVTGCKWPMFHQCTQEILEHVTFSGVPLLSSVERERYQFRSDSAEESATYNTPDAVVSTMHRLQVVSHKLASALNNKIFTSKEIGIIESTRVVCDIGTLMTKKNQFNIGKLCQAFKGIC